ncbi:hypothetical protein BJY24_000136 [Nocardia transvalensis]|uniref:Uncharacterized protein n=1 Tax=Nocardia transvalensis TaxID=37333 RepID=A0A7W9UFJ3_9NOCA|nr:hypothetical protein [Nocardia transvalensis]MBB5911269.1 hypothetical protein [Nocardia transvalensis]
MLSVPPFGGPGTGGRVLANDDGTESVVVSYDDAPGPWKYAAEGRLVNGVPMITELLVSQRDPSVPVAITQTGLRRVQLRLILNRVKRALKTEWGNRVSQLLGDARTQTPKSGRSWHAEHYMQVAWWYIKAEADGVAARKAIAEHWGVSRITASRWLSEARKRGYLAPYAAGKNERSDDDLWSRQQFATSTVEASVVQAFLNRTVAEAMKDSPETALAKVLDTLLTLGAEAISRTTRTENGKDELGLQAFFDYLFALAEQAESDTLRASAKALVDALTAEGLSE